MIRKAGIEDIPALLEIGRKFCAAAKLSYDSNHLASSLVAIISNDECAIFMFDDGSGAIGGISYQNFFSGEKIAQELFWWADTNGIQLLVRFEKWAADLGACKVIMLCLEALSPQRVAKLYQRAGYTPLEYSFVKVI